MSKRVPFILYRLFIATIVFSLVACAPHEPDRVPDTDVSILRNALADTLSDVIIAHEARQPGHTLVLMVDVGGLREDRRRVTVHDIKYAFELAPLDDISVVQRIANAFVLYRIEGVDRSILSSGTFVVDKLHLAEGMAERIGYMRDYAYDMRTGTLVLVNQMGVRP